MKNTLLIAFTLITFFSLSNIVFANSAKCSKNPFTDDDKRDFGDKTILQIDVNGDGEVDMIKPRIYKTRFPRPINGIREIHWITFDLKTSKGKMIESFFTFKYGDNRADYWVYALVPCKIKSGERNDLLFYAGDDTSDKTVILENNGTSFKVFSRKEKVY